MRTWPSSWEQSGVVAEDGRLSRSLLASEYFRPPVLALSPDEQRIEWENTDGQWPTVRSSDQLLDDFIELARGETTPSEIFRYARRWGVLNICSHNLPALHAPGRCEPRSLRRADGIQMYYDSIDDWRRWARQARAAIDIAAQLHLGRLGRREDWRVLIGEEAVDSGQFGLPRESASVQRRTIARHVSNWIEIGNIRPRLVWETEISLRPELDQLFAALALQIALAVAGQASLELCSYCKHSFLPTGRKPRDDKKKYCDDCKAMGIPVKLAQKAFRDRERKQRRARRQKGR